MDRSQLSEFHYTATAPRGFSDLLIRELTALGGEGVRERGAGAEFHGPLALGYRACLHTRLGSRVLLRLAQFGAASADEFYAAVRALDWREHIDPARTLACDFTGQHPSITNTHFGALRLKDGICDQLRAATGRRPDIALQRPAVRVVAHAHHGQIELSLDLAGEGLHRRGYRRQAGEAPLRENVAAGVLLRADWPQFAARAADFLDPLCGAGTLVIEAALMAAQRPPGLERDYFGFLGWLGHDAALWRQVLDEARAKVLTQIPSLIRGSDLDERVLAHASANARHAGVAGLIHFERVDVRSIRPQRTVGGLVCTNPPYGHRLGDAAQASELHQQLGQVLREHFGGWEAAVLTAAADASRALQLRSYRTHRVWNGAIECRLLRIDLSHPGGDSRAASPEPTAEAAAASPGATMIANRLQKNMQRLRRVAEREQVSCYRLYDADMPEYAFAVDRYVEADTDIVHLYVQEYAAPATVAVDAARRRRAEALAALSAATQVPRDHMHLRVRRQQRGSDQYGKLSERGRRYPVAESGLRFLVNFEDYLDTGLFLDHRLTRARLRAAAGGTRFLNLFCYTGSATVYAAAGGARASVSLDLSNTYLQWAAENFRLNGLDSERHVLERGDVRTWLRAAADSGAQFELIFLDPPTFSNSKRTQTVLDVQRDHAALIEECVAVLAPNGLLLFSTNAQRFRLDAGISERLAVQDVSAATLPFDFQRTARVHRCFELRRR